MSTHTARLLHTCHGGPGADGQDVALLHRDRPRERRGAGLRRGRAGGGRPPAGGHTTGPGAGVREPPLSGRSECPVGQGRLQMWLSTAARNILEI